MGRWGGEEVKEQVGGEGGRREATRVPALFRPKREEMEEKGDNKRE